MFARRYRVLSTRLFEVTVVRFSERDPSDRLHDHDRSSLDLVLLGGYTERYQRPFGRVVIVRVVDRWAYRNYQSLHVVTELYRKPTWLLRFSGPLHARGAPDGVVQPPRKR